MQGMFATVVAVVLAVSQPTGRGAAVRTIAHGSDSRMTSHRELVVRTAGWWQFIWHEHSGSFEPPDIDFSRQMVLAVFGGLSPAGTTIEIMSVVEGHGGTTVRYREVVPTTRIADGPRSSPFHIVAVPASRETVTFVKVTAS